MTDKTVEGIFGLSLVALGFLLGYFWWAIADAVRRWNRIRKDGR